MDFETANKVMGDVGALQRRVRGDRRATSVPLLVFGTLTFVASVIGPMLNVLSVLALVLLAPVGFLLVAHIYRRREISLGVGGRERSYKVAALVTVLLLPFFGLFLGEYAIVGLALVVIAVLQRNLQLGAWAFIFGLVGTLERFSLISNRVYTLANMLGFNRSNDGYFSWSSSLVYAVLGLALIAGGFFARHREGA